MTSSLAHDVVAIAARQSGVTLSALEDEARPSFRERLLTRRQLAELPQPSPLIDETIDLRTTAVLSGRRGRGKSFVALDWACCIATGKPWQGRPVTQGKVVWIAAEGAYGLHQRVSAWEYAWQRQVSDDDLVTAPFPVNLYTGRDFPHLVDFVRDEQPLLVVFDTWARSTVGGKENDNSDATLSLERLEQLRHLGATSLVIAHTDADDTKTRGATALEDNVDTVYRLKGDATHLVLNRTKRKDGPEHDESHLKLLSVAESVVVESANRVDMAGRTAEVMSIFMSTFGAVGASKAELRAACSEAGITSSGSFSRGISALVSTGALINHGTDQRPFYKPGAAGEK